MVRVGDVLGIDTLGVVLRRITPVGSWQRRQQHGLLADLRRLRRRAVETALAASPGSTSAGDALDQWLAANATRVQQTLELTRSVEAIDPPSLDPVAVAVRAVEDRLGR
jgi:NAD-specific glutamate dehydrogenase